MDYSEIVKIIAEAAKEKKTLKIFYPETESSRPGWREVEPYSFATDAGEEGEHLVYGKETILPGHIFNGYTIKSNDDHCDSFIIGKIKSAKKTNRSFLPRDNWKVEI
jgi:hypothetical protein